MDWTPEQISRLTQYWNEGLSTAEIGKRLGISKNAVVGKAHRLHLAARPSPIRQAGPRPAMPRPAPPRAVATAHLPRPPAAAVPPAPAPVRVLPLSNQSCSWPIGHPGDADFRFCKERALQGKPYCAEHAAMAYVKPKPKGEAA